MAKVQKWQGTIRFTVGYHEPLDYEKYIYKNTLLVQTFAGRKFCVFTFFSHFRETESTSIEIRKSKFHAKCKKNES